MAKPENNTQGRKTTTVAIGYETKPWRPADAVRGSMAAAEYKHKVLGLIFLKYIFDAFKPQYKKLGSGSACADVPPIRLNNAAYIFW